MFSQAQFVSSLRDSVILFSYPGLESALRQAEGFQATIFRPFRAAALFSYPGLTSWAKMFRPPGWGISRTQDLGLLSQAEGYQATIFRPFRAAALFSYPRLEPAINEVKGASAKMFRRSGAWLYFPPGLVTSAFASGCSVAGQEPRISLAGLQLRIRLPRRDIRCELRLP